MRSGRHEQGSAPFTSAPHIKRKGEAVANIADFGYNHRLTDLIPVKRLQIFGLSYAHWNSRLVLSPL
jgi:hypothetical protein